MAKTLEWRNGFGGLCRGGAAAKRWGGAVPAKSLIPSAASCSARLDESLSPLNSRQKVGVIGMIAQTTPQDNFGSFSM